MTTCSATGPFWKIFRWVECRKLSLIRQLGCGTLPAIKLFTKNISTYFYFIPDSSWGEGCKLPMGKLGNPLALGARDRRFKSCSADLGGSLDYKLSTVNRKIWVRVPMRCLHRIA